MNDNPTLALVLGVLAIALAGALVTQEGVPSGPDEPGIRVATYNVHQWYDGIGEGAFNLDGVLQTVQEHHLDIIGLQESDGSRPTSGGMDGPGWLADRLGYHHVAQPPGHAQTYGLALLSRWDIQDARWGYLPSEATIERVYLEATVRHPSGPIRIIVTHLEIETHPEVRLQQAHALTAVTGEGPVVLLGDFNTPARTTDATYALLAGNFTDAWVEAGQDPEAGKTSPADAPAVRIDHVWLRGWSATDAGLFGNAYVSDHLGVWAQIVPETPPPSVPGS